MKAPVGLLSDRTVSRRRDGGASPRQALLTMHKMQTMQGKNTAFPPVCKKCAKVCKHPEKGKSNDESYDSSLDFGVLEETRIPGPLIKRAHRASHSDFRSFEFTSFLCKAS